MQNERGASRHEVTLPSGIKRTETAISLVGVTIITDRLPNAVRLGMKIVEAIGRDRKFQISSLQLLRPYAAFCDTKEKTVHTIQTAENGGIEIHFSYDPENKTSAMMPQEDFISATYDATGNLAEYQLQAEPSVPKEEEIILWKDALPILINYMRTADPKILDYNTDTNHTTPYDERIRNVFPVEDDSTIEKVKLVTNQVLDQILEIIPFEDREESMHLLESIGIRYLITIDILQIAQEKKISIEEVVQNDGLDNILTSLINEEIDVFAPQGVDFQRIIKVTPSYKEKFNWHEVEIEITDTIDKKEEPQQGKTSNYGETIDSQGNKFKIERNGDFIVVVCTTRRNKSWTATFPLTLPVKDIAYIINDLDGDFRRVKDLVPAGFKRQETKPQ